MPTASARHVSSRSEASAWLRSRWRQLGEVVSWRRRLVENHSERLPRLVLGQHTQRLATSPPLDARHRPPLNSWRKDASGRCARVRVNVSASRKVASLGAAPRSLRSDSSQTELHRRHHASVSDECATLLVKEARLTRLVALLSWPVRVVCVGESCSRAVSGRASRRFRFASAGRQLRSLVTHARQRERSRLLPGCHRDRTHARTHGQSDNDACAWDEGESAYQNMSCACKGCVVCGPSQGCRPCARPRPRQARSRFLLTPSACRPVVLRWRGVVCWLGFVIG